MRGRKPGAAFSLPEILLVCLLFSILTALSLSFLLPVLRSAVRGAIRIGLQQQAALALSRLCGEMGHSTPPGVTFNSTSVPVAVAICPLSQPDLRSGEAPPVQADGVLVWSHFFILYYADPSEHQFCRLEWPPGGPAATPAELDITGPRRLVPGRIGEIVFSQPGPPHSVLAQGVDLFQISYPAGGSDSQFLQPVTFKLVLSQAGNSGDSQPQTFSYSRTVFVWNQRT